MGFVSPASDDRTEGDLAPGQLRIAHWSKSGWYAVVILPMEGSFQNLGLKGSVPEVFNYLPVMAFEDDRDLGGLEQKIPKKVARLEGR